jgi:hypothetical protein
MSRQLIIETLNAAVYAALDGLPVDTFSENGPQPDFANQSRAFTLHEIAIDARSKVSLGHDGVKRFRGAIQIGVFEKLGEGTSVTTQVFDALDVALANRNINGVVMGDSRMWPAARFDQWNPSGLQYLFTFDETD